jgi:phosphatidylinositol dimannoside acyltransferase
VAATSGTGEFSGKMSTLWAIRLAGPIVGRLPWLFYPLAAVAGWVAWWTKPACRRNLTRNMLPLCNGDRRRARREGLRAYQNVARYWVDLNTLPYRNMAAFERNHVRVVDNGGAKALDAPGGLVVVSAHMGNGELAIQAMTKRGRRFVVLVEALKPASLSRRMLRLRSSAGAQFYPADFGGLRAAIDALKRGEVLGMMGDRDIQGTGLCVALCGRKVRLPRGPWELARREGATVLPAFSTRTWTDTFVVYLEPTLTVACTEDAEADILQAIQQWALIFERHLKANPGQWGVLEDFWHVHGCD